ncbi:hypothetical protein ACTXGQ_34835, partial [Marinobacter sp. 1Y8]
WVLLLFFIGGLLLAVPIPIYYMLKTIVINPSLRFTRYLLIISLTIINQSFKMLDGTQANIVLDINLTLT